MKKFICMFLFIFLVIPNQMSAVSSSDVKYNIDDYIVDAIVDVSGNLKVREIIAVNGSFNGYIRDIVFKNSNLKHFTGIDSDFAGSDIYNASNLDILRVGSIIWDGELNFDAFNEPITEFRRCSSSKGCYERGNITNGISLKMFNETYNGTTYFYIEYTLGNLVVLHEDVAEIYYNFIGDMFDDDIDNYQLRINLPFSTTGDVRVWAHGPLNGNVSVLSKDNNFYGGYLSISELQSNTPVDFRMTFPKELISVDHPYLKKSNVLALPKILDVEEKRADEANKKRQIARLKIKLLYISTGTYLALLLGLSIYVYNKYDKERKSNFQNQYNREFIDDYDVTVIEYLFNRKVSEKGFSTSILNMIYKKNIDFVKLSGDDYSFTKLNENDLNEAEKIVMSIIFDDAGDGKTVTLEQIKTYANKVNGTSSPFLNKFEKWKKKVTNDAVSENFYENLSKIKGFLSLFSLLGFILVICYFSLEVFNFMLILLIIFTVAFIVYIFSFTKRTVKGCEHFTKWKAFKRFLLDFGRFDEKELPEIVLWERYLVYANIFGIADKVGKTMKIKFKELNYNSSEDVIFDYILWSNLNTSVNRSVSTSINNARMSVAKVASTNNSSGSGFGGGFSSGGGFGGGGGGGRGF